jgi:predicted kinase
MAARQTVLLGCGLPAVGKSTVLRRLQRCSRGALYLDKDTINAALLGQQHQYFSAYYNEHVRSQTYAVMFALARDNLLNGADLIVMDGQFGDKLTSPAIQAPLQELQQATGCSVRVVYFHCSLQSQLARMRARAEPRDEEKYQVFHELRARMLAVHEQELAGTPHLRVDTDALDEQQCLEAIRHYIGQR